MLYAIARHVRHFEQVDLSNPVRGQELFTPQHDLVLLVEDGISEPHLMCWTGRRRTSIVSASWGGEPLPDDVGQVVTGLARYVISQGQMALKLDFKRLYVLRVA